MLPAMRRATLLCTALAAALGCAAPSAYELRLEGERAIAGCREQRIDTSVCLSVELLQAEYELCLRERPDAAGCDEVWELLALWNPPAPAWGPSQMRALLSGERGFAEPR